MTDTVIGTQRKIRRQRTIEMAERQPDVNQINNNNGVSSVTSQSTHLFLRACFLLFHSVFLFLRTTCHMPATVRMLTLGGEEEEEEEEEASSPLDNKLLTSLRSRLRQAHRLTFNLTLTFSLRHAAFGATVDGTKLEEWGCEVKLLQICDESRLQTVVMRCIFRFFPFNN